MILYILLFWLILILLFIIVDKAPVVTDGGNGHMNTLAIVIATACSVLGVLLLVMVVMVFRRRKPRARLYHPVGAPPPFSRVNPNMLDEHDRVALIGYDAARLPSYEEATRHAQAARIQNADHSDTRSVGSRSVGSNYRPLPSIPNGFRNQMSHCDMISSRNSINTTSTVNRDGISEVFGSIDTVNVSMSDASTCVTLDTLASDVSRRTNFSATATTGSLEIVSTEGKHLFLYTNNEMFCVNI